MLSSLHYAITLTEVALVIFTLLTRRKTTLCFLADSISVCSLAVSAYLLVDSVSVCSHPDSD